MLAVEADLEKITFPLLASYKLDGIRCLITIDGPRSRSLKPIQNEYVAKELEVLPPGLDGELVILDEAGNVDFRATTSGIMSRAGEPKFEYWVFDDFIYPGSFWERNSTLFNRTDLPEWVKPVRQFDVRSVEDVVILFEEAIAKSYEGLILRCPKAAYKHNRSTLKEQGMLKMKPWADAECIIYDWEPKYRNDNVKERDERGFSKRSTKQDGLVALEEMGILVGRNEKWDRIEIGTGFTAADRIEMYKNPPLGQLVRFRYIDVGGYDKPRSASFAGFRHPDDIS